MHSQYRALSTSVMCDYSQENNCRQYYIILCIIIIDLLYIMGVCYNKH